MNDTEKSLKEFALEITLSLYILADGQACEYDTDGKNGLRLICIKAHELAIEKLKKKQAELDAERKKNGKKS